MIAYILQKLEKKVLALFLLCLVNSVSFAGASVYEPLGPITFPEDNPWSETKEKLGKKLFFDKRLSGDNTKSCSSCHLPKFGWSDGKAKALGHKNKELDRNSPTILNTGYYQYQFWDGRAQSLEEQTLAPIQSPVELNQDLNSLMEELEGDPEYIDLFKKAFGESGITQENLAKAIATFERKIVSKTSAYDRYWQGDEDALLPEAVRGMKIFFGKAKCSICHNGPLFTDNQFHNIGLVDESKESAKGRSRVTNEKFHLGAFKTPGLRDVGRTGPYMHDGSAKTLQDVIEFYNRGGNSIENKSPFISPIGLNNREKSDLLEFIISLESDKFSTEFSSSGGY
jgi:cytochrome c peroxidase